MTTYLFNSQLLTRADGGMLLVAPAECAEDPAVGAYLARLVASNGPIREILTFDLRQSMRNGGGPACLRLRVARTAAERAAIRANVWLDDALHAALVGWVERNYRTGSRRISPTRPCWSKGGARSTRCPRCFALGSVYPFQRNAESRSSAARALSLRVRGEAEQQRNLERLRMRDAVAHSPSSPQQSP